ncbi:MAG: PH-like domain-containing protein [Frankiaceae bacterium]
MSAVSFAAVTAGIAQIAGSAQIAHSAHSALVAAPPHRGPDRIGAHLLLALAVLAVAVLSFYGMWRGWRRRVREGHPDLPPLPAPPETGGRGRVLVPAVAGLYVGTVTAEDWLDRVAAEGLSLRATGRLHVSEQGVLIERDDGEPVWLPVTALRSVRIAEALAGHVMGRAGLLVVGWRHGSYELESGFRADDRDAYLPLIAALRTILPADAPASPYPESAVSPAGGDPAPDRAAVNRPAKGRHR